MHITLYNEQEHVEMSTEKNRFCKPGIHIQCKWTNQTLCPLVCCTLPMMHLITDVDLQYTDCTDSFKVYKNDGEWSVTVSAATTFDVTAEIVCCFEIEDNDR